MEHHKSRRKDIFNFIVQVISVCAAFVFGAWAIRSYNAATDANLLSSISLANAETANQLSLSICGANPVRTLDPILTLDWC